jgi:hypothetical protein
MWSDKRIKMAKTTNKPVEVKESVPSKWNSGIRLAIITGSIGFVLGFLAHIGYVYFDNYANRPILSFNIKSLTVAKNPDQEWTFLIAVDQKNTGNSQAIYNIEECNILFRSLQKNPLKIKYDKSITLNQRSTRTDTLEIPLPIKLESNDPVFFNSLQYINLSIEELRTGTKYLPQKDSSNIVYGLGSCTDLSSSADPKSSPNIRQFGTINPKTGDSIYVRGIQLINYHNKIYTNYFFPSTAKLNYKVSGDQIQVSYILDPLQNFLYFPNPDIADRIFFPSTMMVKGSFEDSTKTGKAFHNFQYKVNDISRSSIFYYLFNQ